MGLLGNNKELQFRRCGLLVNHLKVLRTKKRKETRGTVLNKDSISGNWNWKCSSFSLAEL